jgi:hypothetical protein
VRSSTAWTTLLPALFIFAAQTGNALADPIYSVESQVYPVPNAGGSGRSLAFARAFGAGDGEAAIWASNGDHGTGSLSFNVAYLSLISHSDSNDVFLSGSPSTFDTQPFTLAITFTDEASHAQGSLLFPGSFSGFVSPDSAAGTLGFTPGIQSLGLGSNIYTVDLSSQKSWVGQPAGMIGATSLYGYDIQAQVNVRQAPEPTSLTLTGLGLATILGGGLHRWRRRKPVASPL